jgi:hypothetical protein
MTGNQAYRAGFAAFDTGTPLTDCPFNAADKSRDETKCSRHSAAYSDADRADSWKQGWRYAKKLARERVTDLDNRVRRTLITEATTRVYEMKTETKVFPQTFILVPEIPGSGRDGSGCICLPSGDIQPIRISCGRHYADSESFRPANAAMVAAWVCAIGFAETERNNSVAPEGWAAIIDVMMAQLERLAVAIVAAHKLARETALKIARQNTYGRVGQ